MGDLIIQGLKVAYGKNIVLKNIDLDIKKGELIVILGPSGCGKSTLLSAISGLVEPIRGNIIFNNKYFFSREKSINEKVEKRNIGFVFQDYALWPHMSIYKNIAYPLKIKMKSMKEINKRVEYILNMINLTDKSMCYPGELSGGERQRVALARSIVMNPDIVLLDEPLANIDANLKMQLLTEIKKIQRKLSSTMIYVTHDQNEAFEIADRIVLMKEGEIIQEGTPKEIYMEPKNIFVANFIGTSNIIKSEKIKHIGKMINVDGDICIRPEDIKITRKGRCCGRVKRNRFRGHRNECIVSYDNEDLVINYDNDSDIIEGEEIKFDIQKYHVIKN